MKACCSTDSPSSGVRPSTVVTSQPLACTANIRQERAVRPSTSTVQAPQTPCSQPRCVPVRPSSWRKKSASVSRDSTTRACDLPLTVIRVACLPIRHSDIDFQHIDTGAPRRVDQSTRAQDLRQMPPVVAAGMNIGNRLDQPCRRGRGVDRGGIERLAGQAPLRRHRRAAAARRRRTAQARRAAPHCRRRYQAAPRHPPSAKSPWRRANS